MVVLAVVAVLPLFAPVVWHGFSFGVSNATLGAVSELEQPLSIRSPIGIWALGLALAWFALAYGARRVAAWEAVLVVLGGIAVLVRIGNAWLDGLALVAPLALRLEELRLARPAVILLGAAGALATASMLLVSRPPALPSAAVSAALAAPGQGAVLTEWRWAGELQRRVGSARTVHGSGGLRSMSDEWWLDYLRVAQAHARWESILRAHDVDVVVLDADGTQAAAANVVRASPGWRVVYNGEGALVAVRSGP